MNYIDILMDTDEYHPEVINAPIALNTHDSIDVCGIINDVKSIDGKWYAECYIVDRYHDAVEAMENKCMTKRTKLGVNSAPFAGIYKPLVLNLVCVQSNQY